MSMFAQLGKMAADNFIKQAADEDYAKYQKQRMADSKGKLPNNYMEGVKKDFNNKENLKMKQEMKPTMLDSVGESMRNLVPAPRNKSLMNSLLFNGRSLHGE